MSKFSAICEKPTPHVGLPDWYAKQSELRKSCSTTRDNSFDLRKSGELMRCETKIQTAWDTYRNNTRLTDRITKVSEWKHTIETLLEKLTSELQLLNGEKIETENEAEKINIPMRIVARCISVRDGRRRTELTYDDVGTELKKESCIVEKMKHLLTEKIQETWEKLNRLRSIKFKLGIDLGDKSDSLDIDFANLKLDHNSMDISYKQNALAIPKKELSHEAWLEHCLQLKTLADNELSDTYSFREALKVSRERSKIDIRTQQDATDFSLRKRIHQIQKARNELDWQRLETKKEMEALRREIVHLEDALSAKMNIVKCVETRLDNRTYRPGFELCRDKVEEGLREEAQQLRRTKECLTDKINSAKTTYNTLECLLNRIKKDLENKEHSLTTEVMCFDTRSALKSGNSRDIALTRVDKEIPPKS